MGILVVFLAMGSTRRVYWALEYHTFFYFFLKGTIMKQKFILFSRWLLKSPVYVLIMDFGSKALPQGLLVLLP